MLCELAYIKKCSVMIKDKTFINNFNKLRLIQYKINDENNNYCTVLIVDQ